MKKVSAIVSEGIEILLWGMDMTSVTSLAYKVRLSEVAARVKEAIALIRTGPVGKSMA
ncbi:MAG: hypothetical protein M0009_08395 [Deltaproteobacteria bacterium]|nr:hypothetical protein [Deltaproteobacteria bacterium]